MREYRSVAWAFACLCALGLLSGPARSRGEEPLKPTAPPSEANPAVPAAGHSVHGEPFDDGPRQAAYLMPGMGKASFAVTAAKAEARAFIDQGVAQLHSFFYFEAERSFRQAAKLDPGCAMAYWGMATANVNNPKRARGFLAEARKRAAEARPALTRRETLYLDALEALHKPGADEKARKKNFLLGIEAIIQDFPADLDARAWLAMASWDLRDVTSRQAVDITIDSVLQVEVMHPGAHHYRIHLWDGVKPARAEKSAALYGKAAPGIAHAWHMPGHTYTGLKRYADAAYQQEASARVDHAYMARDRVMPFEIHNYAHNNQWLVTSLSHVGRARDGIAVARNLVEQPRDPDKNGKNDGGSAQRSGRIRWAEILCRYELWDDLIAATDSGALDWSDVPEERKEKAYALGLAHAAKGDKAKLAEQIAALKALGEKGPRGRGGAETASALADLEGHQLLAKGDIGSAFERFAKATSMRPEALARAHLAARNYGLAESTAKAAVAKDTNQVPPLAALVEILQAVGKPNDAKEAYRKLLPLARGADPDLPAFRRIGALADGWKADVSAAPAGPDTPTDETRADRVELSTLGPLSWSPFAAEPLALTDTDGKPWKLADHKGRNVVVLFYLGGKCAHCMQQLEAFGKEKDSLAKLGADLVAVGTDDARATKALKENKDGVKFPMPLLADPGLASFKAYRTFDDFEGRPLHGTYLIDGSGKVRYQRVSAEPFLDTAFLKAEVARVNKLTPATNGNAAR
jgi:peroxiredoxin/tetratricopeptide (TPR) repeat protein